MLRPLDKLTAVFEVLKSLETILADGAIRLVSSRVHSP